jgi:O-antigen/teichoic acid export membrane protein
MSKVTRIAKNAIINASSALIVSVFSFISTVIVARYLGSGNYGFFSYAIAYITMFSVFSDFGLGVTAVREIAKDERHTEKYFSNVFALKCIFSFLVFGLALLLIPFLRSNPFQTKALIVFTFAGLFLMLQISCRWIFQALQVFKYEAILNILQGLFALLSILIVIFFNKGVIALAVAWAVFNLALFLISLFFSYRVLGYLKLHFDPAFIKTVLVSAAPLGFAVIANYIYVNIDKIILFQMTTDVQVGLYSAASKIMLFLKAMVFMYMPVVFPAFSSFWVDKSSGYFDKLLSRSFYYILMLTLALAVGGTILADRIIILLFGGAFTGSVSALQLLMWALPLTSVTGLFTCCLASINRQREAFIVSLVGLIVNVVFNVMFIAKYGFMAAAFGVIIAEMAMLLISFIYAKNLGNFKVSPVKLMQISASVTAMAVLSYLLARYNLFLNIGVSGIAYFVCLIVFGAINIDDWNLIKKIYLKQI